MSYESIGVRASERGAQAALIGALVQLVIGGCAFLVYSSSRIEQLFGLSCFSLAGVLPWGATGYLFLLLKRTSIERLEGDAGPHGESLFDNPEEAYPARRRVERALRWLMPLTGLFFGALLVAAAALGFFVMEFAVPTPESLPNPAQTAGFAALVAFGGFAVSRYVAGMSDDPNWRYLRAGARCLGGCVFLLVLFAVGCVAAHMEFWWCLRWTEAVPSILSAVIGVEVLAYFLLDFYRPRAAGELARPAFESRILGLASSPLGVLGELNAALNYQFGFEVSRTWFLRLLNRHVASLLAVGAGALVVLSCIVVVEPHQKALVERFGRLDEEPLSPGLHIEWPWPFSKVTRYDFTRLQTLVVGSHGDHHPNEPILWSNRHTHEGEELMLAAPPKAFADEALPQGTGRSARAPFVSLLGSEVFIQYRISNLLEYAQTHQEPDVMLHELAERQVSRHFLARDIDELLGPARRQAAEALQRDLDRVAREAKLGLEIVWVGLAGIHPAQQVAASFHETIGAEQERQAATQEALQETTRRLAEAAGTEEHAATIVAAIERLERLRQDGAASAEIAEQEFRIEALVESAGGKAAEILTAGKAERWTVEHEEHGRARSFSSQLKVFDAVPRYFKVAQAMEALSAVLAGGRKFVILAELDRLVIRGDFKDTSSIFSGFQFDTPREGDEP